jgi:WS/DGAT/MGAT family acyltransferase
MAGARLTALDGSFLRVETPSAHMHVGWKGIFQPALDERGRRQPVTLDALRRSIAGRLSLAPRFRQRLAFPPGGLAEPVWVDDEEFTVAGHVTALTDPYEPVDMRTFDALADRVFSEPLDRGRALWHVHLVPRLEDGRIGLVMKIHHAMVDGKSAVELALLLLDVEQGAERTKPAPWRPRSAPSGTRLALDALTDAGEGSLRMAGSAIRLAAGAATRPSTGVRIAGTLRRTALAVGEDLLRPAPASFVNTRIGPDRTLVGHAVNLDALLDIKTRADATLNDVALTAVAGALRELTLARGEEPRPLKVMVPVSTRAPEQAADLGNRISFVFVELPVDVGDPVERLGVTKAATAAFKRDERAAGGETLLGAVGFLPAPLKQAAAQLAASPRMYNLTVSNVPGPRVPVYLLGAELEEAYPVIPLADDHALAIGIFTYCDRAFFGAYADPQALPDVDLMPQALAAAIAELRERIASPEAAPAVAA